MWVFDANTLGWSYIDPAADASTTSLPQGRYLHGAASSELPIPQSNASSQASYGEQLSASIAKIPSLIAKASSTPEPLGCFFICSGLSSSSSVLNDTWLFNLITRSWSALPTTPSSVSTIHSLPSMALTRDRLYLITSSSDLGSEIHYLPINKETYSDAIGEGEVGLASSKNQWTTIPFPTNPLTPGPRPRKGAGLLPVTTGHGREYLLYFLGEKSITPNTNPTTTEPHPNPTNTNTPPTFWSDAFSYQVPAQFTTAASIKDATRSAIGIGTGEGTWAEVKVDARVESS